MLKPAFAIFIACAAAAPQTAHAIHERASLLVVIANNAVSKPEGVALARQTAFELNVRLRRTQFKTVPLPETDLTNRPQQLYAAAAWGRSRNLHRRATAVLIVTPPIATRFAAGLALGVCRPRSSASYAVANIKPGDFSRSLVAAVHEVGHLLGANHLSFPGNWMHPDALNQPFADTANFQTQTKNEINRCLRTVRLTPPL